MLTRLEVSGFKNLMGFDASFGPFTCIAGENGVGKSNVFDVIQFMSLIADLPLLEAAQQVRSTRSDGAGEPEHLFTSGLSRTPRMRLAAEMIVPSEVEDDFGTSVGPAITFLKYELQLEYEAPTTAVRQGRLVVAQERLSHINRGDAAAHLRFEHSAKNFRSAVVVGERRGGAFISTEPSQNRITVHQDGGSRGRPKRQLPLRAPTTVVSTINSENDPTILAAKREMQSWRRIALEPTALRAADRYVDSTRMGSDGQHLAAALHRIAHTPENDADPVPEDVYARVANRLAGLAGLDIRSLRVDEDDVRQLFTIIVVDGQGRELPARSLSEGTLRYLALCVLLEDPLATGLLTMEEPENGIHPANLDEMVGLVQELAVDPTSPPGRDNPLRQVIVNTHSPAVVRIVGEEPLLLAREVPTDVDGHIIKALRLTPMAGTWRLKGEKGTPRQGGATKADLLAYLSSPPGAQISMFDEVA